MGTKQEKARFLNWLVDVVCVREEPSSFHPLGKDDGTVDGKRTKFLIMSHKQPTETNRMRILVLYSLSKLG